MKHYLSGITAIILAIAVTAFTAPAKPSALDPVYDWRVYDAGGNPTSSFIEDKTETQMRATYPSCNSTDITCFQNYNQAHTVGLGLYLKRASN